MELKPIKEKNEVLYPTIKEIPKSKFKEEILLAMVATPQIMPVAVVCYVAVPTYMPLKVVLRIVRNATFITTVIFLFLLIKNKIKMKKNINQDEEITKKTKKHIKINWIFLIISIVVMIGTIIWIAILKNKY